MATETLAQKTTRGEAISRSREPYWTDSELADALRSVAVDGRVTATMYDRAYAARRTSMPGSAAFQIRWGSWNAAVEAAGLTHGHANRSYSRRSNEQLASDVLMVIDATKSLPSVAGYNAWRARHPDAGQASCALIRRRFGSWPQALAAAIALTDGASA